MKQIAHQLGVTEQDVVDMNRRLGGDASLNAPLREEGEGGEWQDWLVDDSASQEQVLAEEEEGQNRLAALRNALSVLNPRERRIFEARRLADDPITLEDLSTEFGVSRERVRPDRGARLREGPGGGEEEPGPDRGSAGRSGFLSDRTISRKSRMKAAVRAAAFSMPACHGRVSLPLAEGVVDHLLAGGALLEGSGWRAGRRPCAPAGRSSCGAR